MNDLKLSELKFKTAILGDQSLPSRIADLQRVRHIVNPVEKKGGFGFIRIDGKCVPI
jgi:hypothetical protein